MKLKGIVIAVIVKRLFFLLSISVPVLGANLALQWDPSPDPGLAKYVIYRGGASSNYDVKIDVPITSSNIVVSNLVAGQTYFFTATAVDTNGFESAFSNEISDTVPAGNSAPIAGSFSVAGLEDQSISIILQGTDADSDPLSYQIVTAPAHGSLSGSGTTRAYTPTANYFGSDQFTYTVSDGQVTSVTATVTITVQAVNDPPTLNALPTPLVLDEDAPLQTIPLSGITSGAPNESQPLTVTTSISGTSIIPSATVSYLSPSTTGSISFKPAANVSGTAWITVTVNDGQPTNNTFYRRFAVTVNPVNDPPTLNSIADMTINQNAGNQTVSLTGISSGATNESQTLTVTASSSNPAIIPNPTVSYSSPNTSGSLAFTPAAGATGSANISVSVNDGGSSNNVVTRTFAVSIVSPASISNLTAVSSDARTLSFSWTTDQPATCAVSYGTSAALGLTSSSTYGTNHSVTLSNLQPATVYYAQVNANTAAGISQTPIGTATTEAVRVILMGAETGVLTSPMVVSSNSLAQNGKYISSSTAGTGTALYDLNVGSGLNYRVWARVQPLSLNWFYVSLDGAQGISVQFSGDNSGAWTWVLLGPLNCTPTNCLVLPMLSGAHRISVRNGSANTVIDEFAIVNDPQWMPTMPTTHPILSAVASSSTTADITWQVNAGNAQNVAVESSTDGVNFQSVTIAALTPSTLRVGSLMPATSYYFRVYAFDQVDRTAYSNIASVRLN